MSQRKWKQNLRSFVIDQTTEYGNPGIVSLTDILSQGLLHEVSVDTDPPANIQSGWKGEWRGCVDSVHEGGIWSSTETFQGVRCRGTTGELHQVVVDGLVLWVVSLVKRERVARML